MGVKVRTKYKTKFDRLPEIETNIKGMKDRKIKVGALKGSDTWLAGIHEYGCRITVTPKMRAYLHSQGLHLRDDTKEIVIPERSFLRAGHDKNIDRVMAQTNRALSLVIAGKMNIDEMLDLCGQQLATAIKTYAIQLKEPSNHPFTREQKGASNPLVKTGNMIESITWKKE